MKEVSLFLLKNSFAAKMRKGLRTLCNDDGSTSTLNQRQMVPDNNNSLSTCNKQEERRRRTTTSPVSASPSPNRMTLEDMILKLEMEEEENDMNRRRGMNRRSSFVVNNNNSNSNAADNILLMSARDALNQYPRFSLDGKDAMYRSSFRTARRSVCCDYGVAQRMRNQMNPTCTFGGERVVWCKPGVVAKLMGLDALPIPLKRPKIKTSNHNQNQNHPNTSRPRRLLVVAGTATHQHHRFL